MTFLLHKVAGIVLSSLVVTTLAFAEQCQPREPVPVNRVDGAACTASPLSISGPDTWSVNTTWTASGGIGPYSYLAGFPLVPGTGTATSDDGGSCGAKTITGVSPFLFRTYRF
jgi:hypothetical protein